MKKVYNTLLSDGLEAFKESFKDWLTEIEIHQKKDMCEDLIDQISKAKKKSQHRERKNFQDFGKT